ncbi:MAG: CDP-glycerol--glycerophosphate glycerophosphotransferase [Clostridiales bacterium]|nr:CDP-glycerol--glycerophosphate glycerophosphotransferase [Clostridiales bacterium]
MKNLFYKFFSLIFILCRFFKVKDGRVALLSPHNAGFHDSLGEVAKALEEKGGFEIKYINGQDLKSFSKALRFFTVNAFYLATSKYIFMNDNFMPMADLNFAKDAVITQLWHAEGAFKKFSLSVSQTERVRNRVIEGNKKLTYVICSSPNIVTIYAEAFGVERCQVLPLGSPRTDYFFENHDLDAVREKFDTAYPECRGKKLILYAPTFRDDPREDEKLLESFDFKKFNIEFGDEYALLLRLHPQIHSANQKADGATDVTCYPNVSELILLCDLLITDYSSICMDFALLNKPSCFYAFDLESYEESRQFYFDYEEYVPGAVAKSFNELIQIIKSENFKTEKAENFRLFNFGNADGKATQRVVEKVLNESKISPDDA